MAEKAGKAVVIKVSGDPVAFTDEATTTTDDQTYQISDTIKQVWDRNEAVVVKEDGVETTEEYTVNKLNGTVAFAAADPLRGTITVSGKYLPMSTAAYAHAFTKTKNCDLMDVTPFLATHRKRIPGLKYASGTLSQWDITDSYFADALVAGEPIVIENVAESGGTPERMWALLESDEMQAAIDSPQDEVVSFISTDELLNV